MIKIFNRDWTQVQQIKKAPKRAKCKILGFFLENSQDFVSENWVNDDR